MSIKTEDSLNCPCNGIYKCGLHSVPKFFTNPYTKEDYDHFFNIAKHISYKLEGDEHIHLAEWQMLHLANIKDKVYD